MSHKCVVDEFPYKGDLCQCPTCGRWWECTREKMHGFRRAMYRRRPSMYVTALRRKAARLDRRTDKRIARYQASKEAS